MDAGCCQLKVRDITKMENMILFLFYSYRRESTGLAVAALID